MFALISIPGCSGQEQVEVHLEGWHDPHQWQGLPFRKVYRVSSTPRLQRSFIPALTFAPGNLSGDGILSFLLPIHVSFVCWSIVLPVLRFLGPCASSYTLNYYYS